MEARLENIETEKYLGPEILLQGSGKLPKSGLAGCQGLTPGHVHGLDLLPGAGRSGRIHAAVADGYIKSKHSGLHSEGIGAIRSNMTRR
jgi:hypothetical protein